MSTSLGAGFRVQGLGFKLPLDEDSSAGLTHRTLSSSFLGLPYRILNMNHKKELLRGLWVVSIEVLNFRAR